MTSPVSTTSLNQHAAEFDGAVADAIEAFPSARLIQRVQDGSVTITHYHQILVTLFPQTYDGPYSIALAAARCSWEHEAAKEYLIAHAAEEHSHWRWALDDLASTGYRGPNPRDLFPHPSCEAYLSFVERVSERVPYARLATASVLEGIAAAFGERYGRQLLQTLKLKPEQATFFLRHSETDQVHREEIAEAIASTPMTPHEWAWMKYVATIAGKFYRAMYDHEAFI